MTCSQGCLAYHSEGQRRRLYTFEVRQSRHEHEWDEWARAPRRGPHGADSRRHHSIHRAGEHPELVAQRLCRFAMCGRERVIAGAACGCASFAGIERVHPSIVWPSSILWSRAPGSPARNFGRNSLPRAQIRIRWPFQGGITMISVDRRRRGGAVCWLSSRRGAYPAATGRPVPTAAGRRHGGGEPPNSERPRRQCATPRRHISIRHRPIPTAI